MEQENRRNILNLTANNKDEYDVSATYKNHEMDWARFCMMPDKLDPVRMPSLFPMPTHIIKRRISKTITVGSSSSSYNMIWSPEFFSSHGYVALTSSDSQTDNIDPALTPVYSTGNWVSNSSVFDTTDIVDDSLAHGGIRLIGGSFQLDYIGRFDDKAGLIESSLHLNSHSLPNGSLTGTSIATDLHFATQDEIQQQPFYSKLTAGGGVRLIWVPIDSGKFEFKKSLRVQSGVPSFEESSSESNISYVFYYPSLNAIIQSNERSNNIYNLPNNVNLNGIELRFANPNYPLTHSPGVFPNSEETNTIFDLYNETGGDYYYFPLNTPIVWYFESNDGVERFVYFGVVLPKPGSDIYLLPDSEYSYSLYGNDVNSTGSFFPVVRWANWGPMISETNFFSTNLNRF
jgi:hypothetical protein